MPTGCDQPWLIGEQFHPEHRLQRGGPQPLFLPPQATQIGFGLLLVLREPEVQLATAIVRERTTEGAVGVDSLLPQPLAPRELLGPAGSAPLEQVRQPGPQERAEHGYDARRNNFQNWLCTTFGSDGAHSTGACRPPRSIPGAHVP